MRCLCFCIDWQISFVASLITGMVVEGVAAGRAAELQSCALLSDAVPAVAAGCVLCNSLQTPPHLILSASLGGIISLFRANENRHSKSSSVTCRRS